MSGRAPAVLAFFAPLLVVGWAGWKGVQEYHLRLLPTPSPQLVMQPQVASAFDGASIATLFGLGPQARASDAIASHELKAVFAARHGHGLALIASAGQEGMYRVGDTLPSGAVLRRVAPGQAFLWHARREHMLKLKAAAAWLATRAPAAPAQRHLHSGSLP